MLLCGGGFAIFVKYFVHNVYATVSYGRKELLYIRTAITHLGLDKDFFYNKDNAQHILQTPHRTDIPAICKRKRCKYRGQSAGWMPGQDPEKATGKAAVTVNTTRQRAIIGQ